MWHSDLHVMHAAPQTRLHCLRMPPEDVHHSRPTQTRKCRPGIAYNLLSELLICYQTQTTPTTWDGPYTSRLDHQLRQCKTYSCKDVYDDLLSHRIVNVSAKNDISTQETSEKGIIMSFFAGRRSAFEEYHCTFVDEGKEAEVAGMLAGGFEDEPALGP